MNKDKEIEDLMSSFISESSEWKIDQEYYDIEKQYQAQFGHTVAREMMPDSIKMEQIKSAMKKCVETQKDDLYQQLGVEFNDEFFY